MLNLAEEERAGCFSLIVGDGRRSVIVAFPGHILTCNLKSAVFWLQYVVR